MSIIKKQSNFDLEKTKQALSPSATMVPTGDRINEAFKLAALKGEFETVKEIVKEYSDELEPLDKCTKRLIAFRGNVKILKFIDGATGAPTAPR